MKERINVGLVAVLVIYTVVMGLLAHHYWKEEQATLEKFEQRQEKWNKFWEECEKSQQEDTLDNWTTLQMAIVMTESQFNPDAVGTSQDWGIFQITPIYAKEVNRILQEEVYSHEDAFDMVKSIEMFNVMQSHYNPNKDEDVALKYHNKADWYAKKVKTNIVFIKRMEEVRKQLKNLREI